MFLGRGVDLAESVHFSNPGYANMISNMTNGKVSIDHFKVPLACCIRRLRFGEARVTERVGDITLSFIQTTEGDRVCILPNCVRTIFTLILCLDEGSIGMAGVGAAAFYLKKMVWVKPDKIHRVIRDLKLAEGHCCGKIFEKTKLWSAYLFGLNARPFNSGTNFTLKESLLRDFQQSVTVECP